MKHKSMSETGNPIDFTESPPSSDLKLREEGDCMSASGAPIDCTESPNSDPKAQEEDDDKSLEKAVQMRSFCHYICDTYSIKFMQWHLLNRHKNIIVKC